MTSTQISDHRALPSPDAVTGVGCAREREARVCAALGEAVGKGLLRDSRAQPPGPIRVPYGCHTGAISFINSVGTLLCVRTTSLAGHMPDRALPRRRLFGNAVPSAGQTDATDTPGYSGVPGSRTPVQPPEFRADTWTRSAHDAHAYMRAWTRTAHARVTRRRRLFRRAARGCARNPRCTKQCTCVCMSGTAPAPASANDPAYALASEATSDCVAAQALAAAADVEGTAGKGSDDADGHVRWAQSKGRKQPPQTPTQRPLPPPKPHQNRCAVRKTAAALAAAHDDEAATAAMA